MLFALLAAFATLRGAALRRGALFFFAVRRFGDAAERFFVAFLLDLRLDDLLERFFDERLLDDRLPDERFFEEDFFEDFEDFRDERFLEAAISFSFLLVWNGTPGPGELRGSFVAVATWLHAKQFRRTCRDCHARFDCRDGRSSSPFFCSPVSKRSRSTCSS
ncbi:MAG: hypothetical protein ACXV7D_15565 [Thermoanaerobaculia bacterium]